MDYLKICGGNMKSTSEKKEQIKKSIQSNEISLWIQAILCTIGLIGLIISFFEKSFMPIAELTVAACLFTMAYNNYKIYKKDKMNYLYIGFGIFLVITTILDIING